MISNIQISKIYLPTLEFSPRLPRTQRGPRGPGSILEPKMLFLRFGAEKCILAKFHLKSLDSDFWGHHAERLVNVKVFESFWSPKTGKVRFWSQKCIFALFEPKNAKMSKK